MEAQNKMSLGPGDKTWKLASKARQDRSSGQCVVDDIFGDPKIGNPTTTHKNDTDLTPKQRKVRSIRDRMLGENGSNEIIGSGSASPNSFARSQKGNNLRFSNQKGLIRKFSHNSSSPRLRKDSFRSQKETKIRSGFSREDLLRKKRQL